MEFTLSSWHEGALNSDAIYPIPGAYEISNVRRPASVEIDRQVVHLARFMDTLFRVPVLGWRFGLNTILDFVPGVGDTITSLICLYILICAVRYRVPKLAIFRMAVNVAVYYIGGLTPFAGDLFDTWWKPNRRNLGLLARYATAEPGDHSKARRSDIIFVGVLAFILIGMLVGSLVVGYLLLHALVSSIAVVY